MLDIEAAIFALTWTLFGAGSTLAVAMVTALVRLAWPRTLAGRRAGRRGYAGFD